ncbi:MAG: type IV pilus twitching motility protein PilT [Burkholderiales bacterium]
MNEFAPTATIDRVTLPSDERNGIGAAVRHALTCAPAITDIVIEENEPIAVMSAAGSRPLYELLPSVPRFLVTREHIVYYLAGSVEGDTVHQNAGDFFNKFIKPELEMRRPVSRRLDGRGDYSIRYTLFLAQTGRMKLFMRLTPKKITPLTELGMPPALLAKLREAMSGLVLVTGRTGAGKTATAMSIIDWHNTNRDGHILTIEDPIEYRLERKRCLITQREVGYDVPSFAEGMHEALRMRPDVLLTSEIRDSETTEQAIQGSETGALLIATMHGKTIHGTLRKLMSFAGPNEPALRRLLSGTLEAIICQTLVPGKDGKRFHMAMDVLFCTGQTQQLIEDGKWADLERQIVQETLPQGEFISMNTRLVDLVARGVVTPTEALRETSNIGGLRAKLGRLQPAVAG